MKLSSLVLSIYNGKRSVQWTIISIFKVQKILNENE